MAPGLQGLRGRLKAVDFLSPAGIRPNLTVVVLIGTRTILLLMTHLADSSFRPTGLALTLQVLQSKFSSLRDLFLVHGQYTGLHNVAIDNQSSPCTEQSADRVDVPGEQRPALFLPAGYDFLLS